MPPTQSTSELNQSPANTEEVLKSSYSEDLRTETIASITVAIVFGLLISWITESVFIQSYTYKSIILLGGLLFAIAKASLTIRWQTNYYWTIGITAATLLGWWLVADSRVTIARYGAIVLGFVFLADLVYMVYAKYGMKDEKGKPFAMDTMSFWLNVAGDALLAIFFFYSLTQTN